MACVATDLSLRALLPIMQSMQMPHPLSTVQNGWLTPGEAQLLYGLSYLIDGPFLEIGAWAGLSTTIIAKAVADSGRDKRFVTAELNPTSENFQPLAEGMGFYHPPGSGVCLGVVGMASYDREIRPVLERRGGVIGLLQENLLSNGVSHLVQIHLGDFNFAPTLKYNFVFSDVAHSVDEIAASLPKLKELFRGRKVVLATHDTTEANRSYLANNLKVIDGFQIDSLFVCEVDGRA